jgi:hypothetical protein
MIQARNGNPNKAKVRTQGGFSTVALILVIVFFAVLPAALFAFEAARASLAQVELQNITDAAALGGTAYLAGSADLTQTGQSITSNQIATMNAAYQFFTYNQMMDTSLVFTPGANGVLWGSNSSNPGTVNCVAYPATFNSPPPLHCAELVYTLLDQNNAPQALGSNTAVSLKVTSVWTERTIFAGYFLPILSTYAMSAVAFGGLPQLDMVLCFDVSGSMDDGSNVAVVYRYYDPNNNNPKQMTYQLLSPSGVTSISSSTGCDPTAGDALFNLLHQYNLSKPTGTPVNVNPPQQLRLMSPAYTGTGVGYNFRADTRVLQPVTNGVSSPGLFPGSVTAEASVPPGNYNSSSPLRAYYPSVSSNQLSPTATSVPTPTALYFTDLVMLLPSITPATGPYATQTFNFGSGAQQIVNCVEASRGNLENANVLTNATCGVGKFNVIGAAGAVVKPAVVPGSYAAYWYGVRQYAYPISTALNAASNFFQTINLSTNAHFALVTFAGTIDAADGIQGFWTGDGSAASPSNSTINNIDTTVDPTGNNYTFGGLYGTPMATNSLKGFPLPCMPLDKTQGNFNQGLLLISGNTSGVIDPQQECLVATGGTNMAAAITQAYNYLTDPSDFRKGATRAAVLFTDGIPTDGADPVATATSLYALNQIPVYTIGLSITNQGNFTATQNAVLGDNQNGSGPGVAYVTGANYFPVQANSTPQLTEKALNSAFEQIAKSLVVLQQN